MAFFQEITKLVKEKVKVAKDLSTQHHGLEDYQARAHVWDSIRSTINKSYSECDELDVPLVFNTIEYIIEEFDGI